MREQPELRLLVDTPSGRFVRRIQPASQLRSDLEPGYAAEEATRSAAAKWGLPDFIYRPAHSTKGRGNLEIGDALLIAGDLAACIQVKMRTGETENAHREQLWLTKKIEAGERQARGSLRRMGQLSEISLVNERGREVPIRASETSWISVVILDHPGLQGYVPSSSCQVLLRRDWDFLFEQMKSTYAVLQYLHHISRGSGGSVALGEEPVRYYQIAQASIDLTPEPFDQRLFGGPGISEPVFPLAPARGTEIVRWVLEDIAVLPPSNEIDPGALMTVLAAIDSTPLALREGLGSQLLSWLREIMESDQPDTTLWRSRRFVSATQHHLIFGVCNQSWTADIQARFATLLELRHQEHIERTPERESLLSVGVLLTPRQRGWDTTLVATKGDQAIDPERRTALERLWGTWDAPGTDVSLPSDAS